MSDRHDVQQHLFRMESWSENLSYWRAHIQSVNYIEEDDNLQVHDIHKKNILSLRRGYD